jgi:hypothetical protein
LQLVGVELLRALAETRTLILLHEQFEAFDRLLESSQFALDMKARRALVFGALMLFVSALMLAIGACAFGAEHGLLCFEQPAQIGRKRCETGGIDKRRRHSHKLPSTRRRTKQILRSEPARS